MYVPLSVGELTVTGMVKLTVPPLLPGALDPARGVGFSAQVTTLLPALATQLAGRVPAVQPAGRVATTVKPSSPSVAPGPTLVAVRTMFCNWP
ncbi:hypothetical protein [Lysobacter antibioticus]|uniref:hypothetical protein n=1 Tax=Lysobacter antibioticus TaxID=84531 RepID=UPI0007E8C429|nr:hypothetical protein [Lysobacter antibioticus]